MASVLPRLRSVHLLILAWVLLLAQSLPLFSPRWVPTGDLLYRYEVFYWYYSEFFFHHDLALWMPYGTYGMPAFYHQWAVLSPFAALIGLLGGIFRVEDTRLLFGWVCVLEAAWFVLGVVLLADRLFTRMAARILVVFGAVLSLTWWAEPYLNLYVYYALPLVFYCLIRFRQEGWLGWLWCAGGVEILSLLGNFPYAAILHVWVVVLFLVPALFKNKELPWPVIHGRGQWPWLVIFLLLTVGFLWFALGSFEGMINLSPGRDGADQRVSWHDFFTYARLDPQILLFNQGTGAYPHWEQDNYVGLASWVLFLYAMARVASPWLNGMGLVVLFLVGTGFGLGIPYLVYHLPGMDRFRHISYLLVMAKVWVLFGAGFGLQHLADRWTQRGVAPVFSWRWRVTVAVTLLLLADGWLGWRQTPLEPFSPLDIFNQGGRLWAYLTMGRLGVYALAGVLVWRLKGGSAKVWILLGAFLLDVGSYQLYAWQRLAMANPPYSQALFKTKALPYLPQRSGHTEKYIPTPFGRSPELTRLLLGRGDFGYNLPLIYTFSHFDPCYPQTRVELFPAWVVSMLESRGGKPRTNYLQIYPLGEVVHWWQSGGQRQVFYRPYVREGHESAIGGAFMLPARDNKFWQTLGCGGYKVRVMEKVRFATTEAHAIALLAASPNPDQELILLGEGANHEEEKGDGWTLRVEAFSSNHLALNVSLSGSEGHWLYYADGWHPHWTATVDGREVQIFRAQVGFKAIALPPGEHRVVWRFDGGWVGIWAKILAIVSAVLAGGGFVTIFFSTLAKKTNFDVF